MIKTTISVIFLLTIVSLGFSNVYADEIISISLDLQTILLGADEVIPLLNTNNIGNMSKVTVSAILPCNSSNVPDLKITGGILGNTTDIISTSVDYVSLRGPFDTCLFEDTLDIDTASVPAINRTFLKNDGASSVLTNLGTTITLTGIVNPTSSFIVATGGTITTDGNFKVHTFNTSGTFEITSGSGDVEYLVIGGGGANYGGGGAGGYRTDTVTRGIGSYTVTIGAGTVDAQNDGGDSVFDTITSDGGGAGAANSSSPTGNNGGSGVVILRYQFQ